MLLNGKGRAREHCHVRKQPGKISDLSLRILGVSSKKIMLLVPQLKWLYTTFYIHHISQACSMGNMQEEMETVVQLENCDLIATTETWRDKFHN